MEVNGAGLCTENKKTGPASLQTPSSGLAAQEGALNHRQAAVEAQGQPENVMIMTDQIDPSTRYRPVGVSSNVGPFSSEAAEAASAIKIANLLRLVNGQMPGAEPL